MKKVAILLIAFLLVACSEQQEPVVEPIVLDAETYMKLDLIIKLSEMAEKNEQIIKDANIEEVQNYLKELEDHEHVENNSR